MRRPTQSDVARHAGVSRSTVSIVLNGGNGGRVPISHETRRRVLESLRELGYAPNAAAQMLARGHNQMIGVFTYEPLFPYESEDFYHPFLLGIEREASRLDYNLLLVTRGRTAGRRAIYRDGTNGLSLADGCILLGPDPDRAELKRLADEKYPFVYIGRRDVPGCPIDWVASDYTRGSKVATNHLIELGHRRLVIAAKDPGTEAYVDKLAGCREAVDERPDVTLVELSEAALSSAAALRSELAEHEPTAVICADDGTWNHLWPLLQVLRVQIPDDLSFVSLTDGVFNLPPWLRLTEVRLNRQVVGERAVELLIHRLAGTDPDPRRIRVACDFFPGNTTAPPPSKPVLYAMYPNGNPAT